MLVFSTKQLRPRKRLVGVGQAAHAAHDTENVVVRRVDVDVGRRLLAARTRVVGILTRSVHGVDVCLERTGRERKVEDRIVDTGEVAGAGRLEVLGLEREGVDVDARGRRGRVVLVRLDEVEVAALTLRETVLAVELDLGDRGGVAEVRVRVAPRGVRGGVAVDVAGVLDNPDKLLAGVVEGELDLVGRGGDGLRARELELLDEVLVRDLREAAALLRVEVDVVDVERARNEALLGDVAEDHGGLGGDNVDEVLEVLELNVDLDLVVLEGDQGEREAGVAVEPELEGDVERLLRDAALDSRCCTRDNPGVHDVGTKDAIIALAGDLRVVAGEDRGIRGVDLRNAGRAVGAGVKLNTAIAVNHVEVRKLLARGERELIPDVEPLTIVLVDLLAANLDVHVVDHVLAEVGDPGEGVTGRVEDGGVDRGEGDLDVDARDEIAVTGDRALNALAEVANTVESLFDGLHRKVGMPAVELLKKGNLGVRRKVHVLGAIGDELH